ncbi:uncharacterized protein LOC111057315 [Nilaparvata lugens]|uniref:uncharacterized protein LOC111057315 n=1 Tax=Nilaparvata lugens TaxID=108931 RepID=UPI00193EB7EC|nr:uncharacterized protein LOC111057315 [Nilaparvata lugens]
MGTGRTFITISAVFLLMFRNFIFCSADNLQFFEGSSMEITDATNCEHEPVGKGVMTKYVKVSKYNRTHHHVYCNFTIPFYFDDSVMLDLDVKRKLSSGTTVNVIKFQTSFCKFLDRHFKDAIRKMYESGGHYGIDGCPVPAGSSLEITGATKCEHEPVGKGVMTKYVKVSKYNRTHHHVYCNFTIPFYFDDSVMLDLDVKRKSSSGATVNVIKFQTSFCKFLDRHFKDAIRKMFESGGHYGIGGCPVPAGTYVFDSDLDLKVTNIPYTPFGDYHATATFYKAGVNRKKVLCIKILFQIKKKISSNKQDNIFSMDNS